MDRFNRVTTGIVGLLLVAAGVYGLLRGNAVDPFFDRDDSQDDLLLPEVTEFVQDTDPWFWLVAAILALLLAYLGLRWLRAQLTPSASLKDLTVTRSDEGRTRMTTRVVADAVTRDLESDSEINSARVRLVGSEAKPALDVRASVADAADPATVRHRIETEYLARARQAMDRGDLGAKVRLRLGDPTNRTVV